MFDACIPFAVHGYCHAWRYGGAAGGSGKVIENRLEIMTFHH